MASPSLFVYPLTRIHPHTQIYILQANLRHLEPVNFLIENKPTAFFIFVYFKITKRI